MSKTAIVPELLPCPWCHKKAARLYLPTCEKHTPYNPADRAFPVVRCACGTTRDGADWDQSGATAVAAWNARPRAPDELIEEAAKAMHAAVWSTPWGRVTEDARDECRSMARAAARVFNGQVCSSFCAAGEPCSISEDGRCFLGGRNE